MKYVTTVIIGAGHSGLAMSRRLTEYSIDHVVLEQGQVANSWRTDRWDSLRLLSPNWQSRLPGYAYDGDDPDGYMTMPQVIRFLETYAQRSAAPIVTGARVVRVRAHAGGYEVASDQGTWRCRKLVIATGANSATATPSFSRELPAGVTSLAALRYRSPQLLPEGGVLVVGASASGVQLARELIATGRRVVLATGEHVRVPRLYRGRDILWWMDAIGAMDLRYDEIEDIGRARRLPSFQLIGTSDRQTVDLNSLHKAGVEIVGRLVGVCEGVTHFSGALANHCALADLKMNRLLQSIDNWASSNGTLADLAAPCRFAPTQVAMNAKLSLDLKREGIATVLWATGNRPNYAWLDVPVFDPKGQLRHDGGVVAASGIYVMGLPFMRRRKSSFIDGAAADATELAAHLKQELGRKAA